MLLLYRVETGKVGRYTGLLRTEESAVRIRSQEVFCILPGSLASGYPKPPSGASVFRAVVKLMLRLMLVFNG